MKTRKSRVSARSSKRRRKAPLARGRDRAPAKDLKESTVEGLINELRV